MVKRTGKKAKRQGGADGAEKTRKDRGGAVGHVESLLILHKAQGTLLMRLQTELARPKVRSGS